MRTALSLIVAGVAASVLLALPVHSQDESDGWQLVAFDGLSVGQILTTASGGLFVMQHDLTYQRSDDGGATWMPVNVAAGANLGYVDSVGGQTLFAYAVAKPGILRSLDGGATWQPLPALPIAQFTGFVVSPVDPRVMFVSKDDMVMRTMDGGQTWQTLPPLPGRCPRLAVGHPTVAARVIAINQCAVQTGRDVGDSNVQPLLQTNRSTAAGESWTTFRPRAGFLGPVVFAPGAPGRAFAIRWVWGRYQRETIERTDDDGASWATVGMLPLYDSRDPNVLSFDPADRPFTPGDVVWRPAEVTTLVVDPTNPDQLYAGLGSGPDSGRDFGAVIASSDAGETWTDLGLHGLGPIQGLAVTPDGTAILASTANGLWMH